MTKLEEANEALRRGEEAVKTGIFKWKAEWEIAALEFEKAGGLFRQCNVFEQARHAYVKSSHAHLMMHSSFNAAKSMELAANCSLSAKKFDEFAKDLEAAAQHYMSNSMPDRATELYEKVARTLELEQKYAEAFPFYEKALDLYHSEGRERFSVDTYRKAVSVCLKLNRLDKALALMDSQIRKTVQSTGNKDEIIINRACVSCLIICAAMGDPVEMEKRFAEYQELSESLFMSDEGQIGILLIDAYRERDPDALAALMTKQTVMFLDNEIVRLAKSLRVPGSKKKEASGAVKEVSNQVHSESPASQPKLSVENVLESLKHEATENTPLFIETSKQGPPEESATLKVMSPNPLPVQVEPENDEDGLC